MSESRPLERVLVTGGAGFLGSHLCDRLMDMGCRVICMDNLLTGDPANIAHLLENDRFLFTRYDVTNFVYTEGPLDAVLHFASPASPRDYLEFPIDTLKVGSMGTLMTLGLARAKGARYLLASTSEVYGDPLVSPQPETYWGYVNSIGPRGVYDEAKRFAEAMTMAYHRYHGLDTRIVRIFNTYGPRMQPNDGLVVSNFIVQALRGQPLTVYGNGSQTRSFSYVEDTVEGIVRILCKDSDKTVEERLNKESFYDGSLSLGKAPSIHDPINVGNPQERSILEIARLVLKLTGSRSAIEFHPLPADDPRVRKPDISRAKALVGWQPRVDMEEGIKRTIEYFRAKLESHGTD
ncbi:MAG: Uxs [Dehalococcoidia bacterium]|nr:Uxs [Dehalococcoidia bacterium]